MEENLLHFCTRRKLDGMAEFLLQQKLMLNKSHLLEQKAHDNKTPVELAKKNGMKRISDLLERTLVRICEAPNRHWVKLIC